MNNGLWSQIWVLLLALAISLYFWLGYWVFALYAVAGVAAVAVWLVRRRGAKVTAEDVAPRQEGKQESNHFGKLASRAIERRREQGKRLYAVADAIESRLPQHKRMIKRLLDWYLDYLRGDEIYHKDLYDHLLALIKERLTTAKAAYLRRELELSRQVVRYAMRPLTVEQIVEKLEQEDDAESDSQE